MPESMHMIMWVMSDRAIPRSFRFMEGFGVHTFRLLNAEGRSTFVKFHWKPKLGLQSVTWNEAVKINGADPDFHRRDLWNAIQTGNYPEWELGLQLFDDKFADEFEFDVLDATKLIEPIRRVTAGPDRRAQRVSAETQQVASVPITSPVSTSTRSPVGRISLTSTPRSSARGPNFYPDSDQRAGGPSIISARRQMAMAN
jgi:catalase